MKVLVNRILKWHICTQNYIKLTFITQISGIIIHIFTLHTYINKYIILLSLIRILSLQFNYGNFRTWVKEFPAMKSAFLRHTTAGGT